MANINPNEITKLQSETSMMSTNVIMQMQGESPLDKGMLPRAYGDGDCDDGDSSGDNYRF